MTFSRRDFIKKGSLLGIPLVVAYEAVSKAAPKHIQSTTGYQGAMPAPEVVALNKMALGPRPGDVERVRKMGLAQYIEEQLAPSDSESAVNQRLNALQLEIKYEAGPKYPAVDEIRPLTHLKMPLSDLWKQMEGVYDTNYHEWIRPTCETIVATWVRGVYSKWQLREVMVEFWHNHFNVSMNSHAAVSITMPSYDRDVIRPNVFGNFRQFLEVVAQSPAMLHYLNNKSSKASPANENYARELFELHTLGSNHYYNHLYNRWREVPGALEGKPIGYIDQDVYEAARAFTGWTVADGSRTWKGEERLPNTGHFHYYDGWHDDYQKRVLGVEFDPNQPPLADGRKVLDLVAKHPGTAQHLCEKLCKRLVSDNPPVSLVNKAVETWTKSADDPDQIKQVLRVILNSEEFTQSYGQKVKRPFEFVCSFLRATEADFKPDMGFVWGWACAGYAMFQWPTPTGNPDDGVYWTSSDVFMNKWRTVNRLLTSKTNKVVSVELSAKTPDEVNTPDKLVAYWEQRIFQRPLPDGHHDLYLEFLTEGKDIAELTPEIQEQLSPRLDTMVAFMCMSPEFQWR